MSRRLSGRFPFAARHAFAFRAAGVIACEEAATSRSTLSARPPAPARRARRRRAGFTVIEVSLAAFVLAFGIASAVLALQRGVHSLDVARGTTLASQVLQSEMERLRLLSWTAVCALPASESVDVTSVFSSDVALTTTFTVTRTVADVSGRAGQMKEITLVVGWHSIDGRAHQRTFRTRYAKDGLYDYYYTVARS